MRLSLRESDFFPTRIGVSLGSEWSFSSLDVDIKKVLIKFKSSWRMKSKRAKHLSFQIVYEHPRHSQYIPSLPLEVFSLLPVLVLMLGSSWHMPGSFTLRELA